MFNDLKIRNKLIILVAVPIVIIMTLATVGARSRQGTAAQSRRTADLVTIVQASNDVVGALQREALYSTAHIASGRTAWNRELKATRQASDVALQQASGRLQSGVVNSSTDLSSAAQLANGAGQKLAVIRDTVDAGYRWDQAGPSYASLENLFLSVNQAVTEVVPDPQVATQLRSASALAAYKTVLGREGALLVGGAQQRGFAQNAQYTAFQNAVDAEKNQKTVFDAVADQQWKADVRDALSSPARNDIEAIQEVALARGVGGKFVGNPAALTKSNDTVLQDLHGVETGRLGEVISASESQSSASSRASNLFMISAALATVVAVIGAIILGRQITIPLRHLTDAADRLATEQMPRLIDSLKNPSDDDLSFHIGSMRDIEVHSNDELGQLARSFNGVQRVASEVASEQAALLRKGIGEMFVNLARRNQALLDRQIEFIDELESGEEDPDQLQNLYRLDHLATRMRRNAESLLVLAGAEPPRRRGKPAPLANVVRAALAEVEDFSRIDLLSFDEILVASNAAADLAHLLSELMENATNFSPPETHVEVVGHATQADGYIISVTDHGIGMSTDQIVEANEALAKPPLVGLALSRSLGFIVVGRLAGRHGITVRMMPSPSGGVTAVVSLPGALVTTDPGYSGDAHMEVPQRLKTVMDTAEANSHNDLNPIDLSPIIEPLTFTPFDAPEEAAAPSSDHSGSVFDDAPGRLAEAVPTGAAFDAGLEALIQATPEETDLLPPPPIDSRLANLPPRRKSKNGTPTDQPELAHASDDASDADAQVGDQPAEAAPPRRHPLPEALLFADPAPTPTTEDATNDAASDAEPAPVMLDGPPPSVSALPGRGAPTRPSPTPAGERTATDSTPFFLEEAPPPRLFGRAETEAEPVAPAAPVQAPPVPSAPAPAAAAQAKAATGTLVSDGPPPRVSTDGPPPRLAAAPAPAPVADPSPTSPPPAPAQEVAPALTTAGLAKRVPRSSGAERVIPGADVERGVAASKRSPEEVRSLLSQYSAGRPRARTEEPVPAGPSDEGAHS